LIESITLTGFWIYAIVIYFTLDLIYQFARVLAPNNRIKRIIRTNKMPSDNADRFGGTIGVIIAVAVLAYVIGVIT